MFYIIRSLKFTQTFRYSLIERKNSEDSRESPLVFLL